MEAGGAIANATAAAGGASAQTEALPVAHRRSARGSAVYNPLGSGDGSGYEACTRYHWALLSVASYTRVLTYLHTNFQLAIILTCHMHMHMSMCMCMCMCMYQLTS